MNFHPVYGSYNVIDLPRAISFYEAALAEVCSEPTAEEELRLRAEAKEYLPARTRFGICSAKKHICYS